MKQYFFSFLMLVFVVACQKVDTTKSGEIAERTVLNVSYGTDTAQRMDVYLPANRTTTGTKVLVLVHGGAWSTGDKTDFNEFIPVFKQRLPGYAIFNINYRLGRLPATNPFPTQENDVNTAFTSLLSKADDYLFNKEKVVVLGASAGAHLALLQSYKNGTPAVQAVVDMFGPTDMVALYNSVSTPFEKMALQALLGGTPATNASMYQRSSPINFVSAQSPPTLILHGGQDPLVPVSQSTALKATLEANGVPVQLFIYPTEGHGWFGPSLTDSYGKIAAFFTTYNP